MRIQNPFAMNPLKSGELKQNRLQEVDNANEVKPSSQAAKEGLKAMGFEGDSLLEKAYDVYKQNGVEPTIGVMQETKLFASQVKGSDRDKLFTIEMTAQKGVDPTAKNLSAIHTALNETENQAEAMNELMPEIKKAIEGRRIERDSNGNPIQRRSENVGPQNITAGAGITIESTTFEGVEAEQYESLKETLQAMGFTEQESKAMSQLIIEKTREGHSIKGILGTLVEQKVSSVDSLKALVKVAALLGSILEKPSMPGLVKEKVQLILEALQKTATQDQAVIVPDLGSKRDEMTASGESASVDAGFEERDVQGSATKTVGVVEDLNKHDNLDLMGIENADESFLSNLFETLESLDQKVSETLEMTVAAYGQAELTAYFSSENTKVFRIQEVTVKMIEVKATFDAFQKQSMDQINQVIAQGSTAKMSGEQMGQAVSMVSQKLDTMIMKSDLTLYTDMKTERKLIQLSSDLQQVQGLALKDPLKAIQLLKQVQKKMEALIFQPSKDRIQAFMTQKADELLTGIKHEQNGFKSQMPQAAGGAKMLLEVLRGLGLNHEPELLKQILNQKSAEMGSDEKESLKSILLKMEAESSGENKTVKAVEKMMMNLTGQQLLNKQDPEKDQQTLFFNVPMGPNGQDAKLYIKARQQANRLDWENCTAFVLVDLKHYGPTGIRLNITDRHLAMSVLTDSDELKEKMEPQMTKLTEELRDIGYLPGEVKFLKTSPKEASEKVLKKQVAEGIQKPVSPDGMIESRKGFELKI